MPLVKDLQEAWQASWYPSPELDVALDFSSAQRKTKQTMGNDGWLNLLHMHDYFSKNPPTFAGVDWPYSVRFGEHTLVGKIDILAYTGSDRNKMQGIKLCPSSYEATKMYGYNGLEMVAYRIAIKGLMDKMQSSADKVSLGFFVMENINKPFYTTRRTDDQEEVLSSTVDSVCRAIESDMYYPDFGYKCHNCDYKPHCNKGRWVETD
jgi:hypothetical protein